MGCDIHIYAEKKINDKWEKIDIEVPRDRNYWSFGIMANVRNGYGFAGCELGDPLPYFEPRGLPEDTTIKDNDLDFGDKNYVWLGDHSYSWLLISELMSVNLGLKHRKKGYVKKEIAEKFKKDGLPPKEWCGGTTQSGYEKIEWMDDLKNSAYLIPEIIEALKSFGEPDEIRLVFGFDN